MFNFFIENANDNCNEYKIVGADYNHLKNVLRLSVGEKIYVSHNGVSDLCEITEFMPECVLVKVIERNALDSALSIDVTLFQGLPKSDKLEFIIQKAVELGANGIVPVEMKNCVVKIEEKKKEIKRTRWQAIAESAAKQSKRNNVPTVFAPQTLKQSLEACKDFDLILVPYENHNGMQSTIDCLSAIKKGMKVGVFIGPEGGFDKSEISSLLDAGAKVISLGKRILRTETASITALSMLMLKAETL